jgi:protein-disulfide isomerase
MLSHKRPGMTRVKIVIITLAGALALVAAVAAVMEMSLAKLMRQGAVETLDSLNFESKFTTDKKARSAVGGSNKAESDSAPSVGSPDAPLRVVEFVDFSCPFSKEENAIIRGLVADHPDKVMLQVRDFPVSDLHPDARAAAVAADCAGEQDKYWAMHDSLFANQKEDGSFTADELRRIAIGAGVDGEKYDACLASKKFDAAVAADYDAGTAIGVTGTPTFFINGFKVDGAIDAANWQKVISLVK